MASLVIKRPLMYVLNGLFYLLLPPLPLPPCAFNLLNKFLYYCILRACFSFFALSHTSDIWLTLLHVTLSNASQQTALQC